jgi:hypothetical protein
VVAVVVELLVTDEGGSGAIFFGGGVYTHQEPSKSMHHPPGGGWSPLVGRPLACPKSSQSPCGLSKVVVGASGPHGRFLFL